MSFAKKNFSASNSSTASSVMSGSTKKSANPSSTSTVKSTTRFLEVIDPINRTGKITIPMEHIQNTKGMNESTRPKDSKDLSLCLLFQKGRCNAGSHCHQIHADAAFVNKLRSQATTGSSCCALHGDFNSNNYLTASQTVDVITNGVSTKYSLSSFGKTQTLDTMLSAATKNFSVSIRVNSNKICRLHSQSRCKFGKDCKNIHMCPKAKPVSPSDVPAPLSGFTPTTVKSAAAAAPLGSSYLNSVNRKLKSTTTTVTITTTPAPESSTHSCEEREEGEELGLSATVASSTSSSSSPPSADEEEENTSSKSLRSASVESNRSHNGLSPNPSPEESPKEKKSFSEENNLFFSTSGDEIYKKNSTPVYGAAPQALDAHCFSSSSFWGATEEEGYPTTPLFKTVVDDTNGLQGYYSVAGFDASEMSPTILQELSGLTCAALVSPSCM